jgi:hypothetical protein
MLRCSFADRKTLHQNRTDRARVDGGIAGVTRTPKLPARLGQFRRPYSQAWDLKTLVAGVFLLAAIVVPARAHDPTGYWAQLSAEGKAPPPRWWNALHSSGSNTPCCDVADGVKVEDVDWDTQCATDGTEQCHYRVHLDGKWVDVPAAAVVNEPNRFGPAVVWPVYATDQNGGKYLSFIRCFLAGALS